MSDPQKIFDMIKENDVQYVDYRFTDPRGKWQHLAMHRSAVDEDALVEGVMFDGSSIAGWKAINDSDMTLVPDLSYEGLAISDGSDASAEIARLMLEGDSMSEGEQTQLREDLLKYCKRDTEAMVGLVGRLREFAADA